MTRTAVVFALIASLTACKGDDPTTGETGTAPGTYANCAEARAAGAGPLRKGDAGYRPELDRDGDGVACDK